ncbi:DUF664 domain-containing protein [Actinopolymorpha sp. B9G3]|uniref:mycothiol transferase n=1 Tax=Actinopolymorpha sp. B9G3 TaxID=3158970 RepID=UPI0032D94E8C
MTSEMRQLRAALDGLRAGVLKKLAGLSEADARRSTVDSGTNLAGLLQHLTYVESLWFEEVVAGGTASGIRSMQVDPSVSLRTLRAGYKAACETSNRIVEAIGDLDAPVTATARPTTCGGCCSRSSRKRPGTPGMPTSSANRSTDRPGGDAEVRAALPKVVLGTAAVRSTTPPPGCCHRS